jgi:predicted house-cleaning noncanonical NTP pyrophosphatase (MazG superfamily)
MKHNKLVRDRIPEIIVQSGSRPVTHIANDREYGEKLKEKLFEEVAEYLNNEDIEELADILEVIIAICNFKYGDFQNLEKSRKSKQAKNGGFEDRVILDEVVELQ